MNSESKAPDVSKTTSPDTMNIKTDEGGSITAASASTNANVEEVKTQVLAILSHLFSYIGKFFDEYQKPITNVALIVASLITLYLVAAVVDAINDIPLLAPFFELIGIAYTIWFVRQYWSASAREELWKDVQAFLDRVAGSNKS